MHLLHAGELSVANSAMNEAEAQIRQGLVLAASITSQAERNRRQAGLTLMLGNVRMAVQGIGSPAHRSTFAEAADLCRLLDPEDAGAARLLARALFGQWSSELQAETWSGLCRSAKRYMPSDTIARIRNCAPLPAVRP